MTGILLAGGLSTRLQPNKAYVQIDGMSLIERQIRRLDRICRDIILVSNDLETHQDLMLRYALRAVQDRYRGKGPLGGIHAGLEASAEDCNFVLACDMPFFSPGLACHMASIADEYQVVVPRPNGFYEPLHAIYRRDCIPAIEEVLAKDGIPRVISFYSLVRVLELTTEQLEPFGDPELIFFNVNTPADLETARRLLGASPEIRTS